MSQKEFESVKLSGWVYRKDKTLINVEDFIAEFTDWIEDKNYCFQALVVVTKTSKNNQIDH